MSVIRYPVLLRYYKRAGMFPLPERHRAKRKVLHRRRKERYPKRYQRRKKDVALTRRKEGKRHVDMVPQRYQKDRREKGLFYR
ncbi:hypothetical protein BaRGS_00034002 [Batillaria attramentaria]|uniref:Uncharacterized protein n=1 Tax=Batillaria attramentaria TaxID=370345 RepID=A0ABD0JIK0_9CAEN